ncbi:Y55_G0051280.mRNA.1.CDS.1 [Saccharomyces cerevisiae]|nr:Y55_G0051280.mRNA.1.CDS.1 [Saccharomyces cerevisiae]
MMIIIFIELCRIADSLLWIPKSSRRTSSIFYIPNIIALLKMESQQLSQNSPTLQKDPCIIFIITALLTSNHECSQINQLPCTSLFMCVQKRYIYRIIILYFSVVSQNEIRQYDNTSS